jgi:hypothetical protein
MKSNRISRSVAVAVSAAVFAGLGVGSATTASAACTTTAWSTYTTKTLAVSWSYLGSTAKVTGKNSYQKRTSCGFIQVRSVLALTAAQGTYTKATNADVRWSTGTHSGTFSFPKTLVSPINSQTTTVTVGFEGRYGAATTKTMTYDY